jgi:hypothetical protein
MAARVAVFVSKRLQRAFMALLCLTMAQFVFALASCQPEPLPMAVKVAIPGR